MTTQQMAELYNLAAKCKDINTWLACDFQHLTGQEAVDWLTAQASAQETINTGRVAHAAAFTRASATQSAPEIDATLQQLCTDANQSWKDTNGLFLNHLLRYD